MGQLFKDVGSFLGTLSFIDFVLYFAVLILVILIITLIYIIKSESLDSETVVSKEVLDTESLDLRKIVETIDEKPEPIIDMTLYEAEQEEKAIISYDELIQSSKCQPLQYDEEKLIDNEVCVKKISLSDLPKPISSVQSDCKVSPVQLMKYDREEAFLKALKQLNELLN